MSRFWLVWALIALLIGLSAGYWYGSRAGLAEGIKRGVLQEKAAEGARRKEAEKKAAEAVNPFGGTVNPFEGTPTNPFEKVKVNPFE